MKIISWNVRGMNKREKRLAIKREIANFLDSIVILVETKIHLRNALKFKESLWPQAEFLHNYQSNLRGRIWLLWDAKTYSLTKLTESSQSLQVQCKHIPSDKDFMLTAVYASNILSERRVLWKELDQSSQSISLPWIVIGDFNMIRQNDEKCGGRRIPSSILNDFNDSITSAGLLDMKHYGNSLSWCNNKSGLQRIRARLDRALINYDWLISFAGSYLDYGPNIVSDHAMLRVEILRDEAPKKRRPFKFFSMWTSHPDFLQVVQEAWNKECTGSLMSQVCQKLKLTKLALKHWNWHVFGDVKQRLTQARESLILTQSHLCSRPDDVDLQSEEKLKQKAYLDCLATEESFAKQKSKQQWLTLGDSNTKFFYASIKARRAVNSIKRCKDANGSWIGDENMIREHTKSFYSSLLNQQHPLVQPHIDITRRLSAMDIETLLRPFTKDDVYQVIMNSPKGKSPGPDGFPAEFYQKCWPIVGDLVSQAILEFFLNSKGLHMINSTFITLIPKSEHADSLEQFRPISLCNFLYKVITKLLANRLQLVLPTIINPSQAAFIKGRSIQSNILLANDLTRNLHSKHRGNRVCLKADLHKAFDSISWNFLFFLMHHMGFPPIWIDWIKTSLETAKFSILLNGCPEGFFSSTNGVRQGDPLSPYLFTIVMEGLSCLLDKAVSCGLLKVPTAGNISISHIIFADDLLIFLKDDVASGRIVKKILDEFHSYSGLQLNASKSRVYIGAKCRHKRAILEILQVPAGELPTPYLGLPLLSTSLKKSHCHPILHKIRKSIDSWRTRMLSRAGRLELIRSVLSSYSLYWSSSYLLPASFFKEMDKILSTFFWSGSNPISSLHMISWKKLCFPKSEGGLGLKCLVDWNRACCLKNLWDILTRRPTLWTDWVYNRYLRSKSIWAIQGATYNSWAWKGILSARHWIMHHISFTISNGVDTSFFYDPWINGKSIYSMYGDRVREALGVNHSLPCASFITNGTWNLPPPTCPEMLTLWPLIEHIPLTAHQHDSIQWKHGTFSTKNVWGLIRHQEQKVVWWKWAWKKPTVQKFSLTCFQAILHKLPTLDNLKKRGFQLASFCPLCYSASENEDHLFCTCPFSSEVWMEILHRLNITRRPKNTILEEIRALQKAFHKDAFTTILARLLFRAYIWWIWKERCQRIFDDFRRSPISLTLLIIDDVRYCIEAHDNHQQVSGRAKAICKRFNIIPRTV